MSELSLKGRVALVTGASRGIGAAIARGFADAGAQLVLVARTVGGLEEVDDAIQAAGHAPAVLVPMDLKDNGQIDQLAVHLAERFGKLDLLVANAGVLGDLRPMAHFTDKIWNEVMQVNVTANHRLLRACEPLLKQSDAPRVLGVTSGVTQGFPPFWGAYAVSKAALEAMFLTYAHEQANSNMRVNLIDPGVANTAMRKKAVPGEDPSKNPDPATLVPLFLKAAAPDFQENGVILRA